MIYHVSMNGRDTNEGTREAPLRTISRAAAIANAGDRVVVHEGVYREWVSPQNGGLSDDFRVVYEAAPGEKVVIKGSEVVRNWANAEGNVWKAEIANAIFADYNPFEIPVAGDWMIHPNDESVHTADVYINGMSMYEAKSLDEVKNPVARYKGFVPPWSLNEEYILNPEGTVYQWFAQVQGGKTVVYANFQGMDPNEELVEVNVRPFCFYPKQTGINYITVRGFEMCHAACPWAPPTADQPGMLGAHWSKGWIIEKNHLHDAKCSAISVGKEITTGHNLHHRFLRKPGYQYQMESVFLALRAGWCKENIGSHIIRDNVIHDCGQNGIVGHMGGAFSIIERNHIYNIAVKHEFFGYEIAGIKMHAAVDTKIANNLIHNCTLGVWLDWQAQGTRVSNNVLFHNDRDLMIEVTHGPCLVDGNIFLSRYNFDNAAQGTAFVYNLCCGYMRRIKVLDRATPYHYPHSTKVAGCAVVYSGDDRLMGNIFAGPQPPDSAEFSTGTAGYDDCPASWEEYHDKLASFGIGNDHDKYFEVEQCVYINSNVYLNAAKPFRAEENALVARNFDTGARLTFEGTRLYLDIDMPDDLIDFRAQSVSTATLGMPRITEERYENPDGTPISFDIDATGDLRAAASPAGPLCALAPGHNHLLVWQPGGVC